MSNSTSIIEQSYAQSSLSLDIRPDGRARLVYRPLSIATGITPQANGSAQVSASNGNTHVLAGVKLEVCSAAELAGAEGQIVFSVEAYGFNLFF